MNRRKRGMLTLIMGLIFTMLTSTFSPAMGVGAQDSSSRVDNLLDNMSTRQKVTQLLMPDFRNWKVEGGETQKFTEMNEEVEEIIDEYDFGGVILFAENVVETEQTARLTHALQEAALKDNDGEGHDIPLLIGIDQEGGIVYRLGTGTALPGNMAIGATNNPEYAKNVGQIIGRELSSLGINTNFAPSMDVNNNPKNPVIGLRSYSSDPEIVTNLGLATIQGLKEYNIAGAAKHFPGHGDTDTDSHFGLPMIDKSMEELKELELLPFQAAMDNGIDMVMTGHLLLPQVDADYPATLSKKIITGIAREDMNYDGVIITDAMNMNAITEEYSEVEAAKLSIEAGIDIVLMPTILREKSDVSEKLEPLVEGLVDYANENEDFMKRVDESAKRVLQLKEDRGILDYEAEKISPEEQVSNAKQEVGSDLNRDLERKISRDAVTVVKNEDQNLPFDVKSGETVLLVGAYSNETPGMEFAVNRLIDEGVIPEDVNVKTQLLRDSNLDPLEREEVKEILTDVDYAVVISEVGVEANLDPSVWLTGVPTLFVEEAEKLDVDAAIMSISNPYDTANYPAAKSIVAVYGAKGMDPTENLRPDNAFGPNIPAGIEIIFGKDLASGKLPIDIPELDENYKMTNTIKYNIGHGYTLAESDLDYSELETSIAKAESLDLDDYTATSVEKLQNTLAKAIALNGEADDQEAIDDMVAELEAAVDGLEKPEVVLDYKELEKLIKEVEKVDLNDYTKASAENLSKVLAKATALIGEADDQKAIDDMVAELEAAVDGLEKPKAGLDYKKLEKLITEVEDIDVNNYTTASVKNLQNILEQAKSLINRADDQAAIDDMVARLQAAQKSLAKKETGQPEQSGQSGQPGQSGETGKQLPHTATNLYNFLAVGVGLIAIGALLVFIRRRKIN